MEILIIGSGLIGVTSAYFLRRRGHDVTVLDREPGPGMGASFANGTLLTPSMSEPWNAPGSWRPLLASLGRSDAPLQLHLRELPNLAGWGINFLRNSRRSIFERSTLSNLGLALHSLEATHALTRETGIEYDHAARGSMRVFRDQTSLEQSFRRAKQRLSEKLSIRRLSTEEAIAIEPALAPVADKLSGALYFPDDEAGDAFKFCNALTSYAREAGVHFSFGTEVSSLAMRSGQVSGVLCGTQRFSADRYVVAAGSYSTLLLRDCGLNLPVRPSKGYSVTFEGIQHNPPLSVPVADDHFHAVVAPVGGTVRVAGTAEFAGYDRSLLTARVRNLQDLLPQILPQAKFDPAAAKPWCGLRSISEDGVPIVGPTPVPNLYVNTGHGHLGWTMAAGSAQLLADLLCGDGPSIDPKPFAFGRFLARQ